MKDNTLVQEIFIRIYVVFVKEKGIEVIICQGIMQFQINRQNFTLYSNGYNKKNIIEVKKYVGIID